MDNHGVILSTSEDDDISLYDIPLATMELAQNFTPGTSTEMSNPHDLPMESVELVGNVTTVANPPALKHPGTYLRNVPRGEVSRNRHYTQNEEMAGPPMIIMMPSSPKMEDWVKMRPLGRNVICVSGSATTGKIGPSIGRVNINESDDSYMFLVGLPGVRNNENEFSCLVDGDGRVEIKGTAAVGEEFVELNGRKFKMLSKNLGTPGEVNLKFNLPGPVDPRQFRSRFTDGMLEAIVMKPKKNINGGVDGIIMSDANPLS